RAAGHGHGGRPDAPQQGPGKGHQSGLAEVGVLAQRHLRRAEERGGHEHSGHVEELAGPPRVGDERGGQHQWPPDREGLAVDRDEPVGGHAARTAADRSRTRLPAASGPPAPNASTTALPTTTPSPSAAAALACAGAPIPKPTASASEPAARN